MEDAMLATIIFSGTYWFIITEKLHKATIALFGAALMVLFKILTQEEAFHYVDFNTIGLLIGMMIIVAITKRTGLFQYLAIKAAKSANGDPVKILVSFSIVTAISSALLDNVTTVLLMAPVTLLITDSLEVNPTPYLITQILASNIGGTATLIGDPPNIMIGSATDLGFLDFVINLAPVVIVIFVVIILILKKLYGKDLSVSEDIKRKISEFDEDKALQDKQLLIKSIVVLGITILGFAFHQTLGLESAIIALFGASLLLVLSNLDPEKVLEDVEWPTIFFFGGLFVIVGGLEAVGIIEEIAYQVMEFTQGDLVLMALLILWVSALASTVIDNIPFVATMIPIIKAMSEVGAGLETEPLWWALALGACLGGNGSLVGASANVVVAGIADKHDNPISFTNYLKVGFPLMLLMIVISSIYIYLRYLI
ncbi:ArsB/NhaD family transporter [Selenihalanaerobacter shriftii]|uniref:Possible tyrosine transporter P-protein n=1 Tax=Selenihalanaerobacter shriftii TaxID=142842 RepID=A0A1T4L169_9FIRM|nr:ArsB/NhaD family transporter [Selenihalanaerobacter shriftii]SJZ48338.1 possible tyrosine transporter P-protein [Selenihalanaerobacter shriftii]